VDLQASADFGSATLAAVSRRAVIAGRASTSPHFAMPTPSQLARNLGVGIAWILSK
jgi:hypothetical protein